MHALEYDVPKNVIAILTGEGRERDIATWRACAEIAGDLARYKPNEFRGPDGWRPEDQAFVNSLRFITDYGRLAETAAANARIVGAYRNAVLNHEGEGARKLQTLVWAMRELYRLRDLDGANLELIDPPAQRIGDVLVLDWQLRNVPLEGDYRDWSVRSSRRYDLCPKRWRHL